MIPNSEKTDLGDRQVPVTAVNPQSSTNPKSTFKRGLAEIAYEINQGETSIEQLLSPSSTRGWDEGDINLLVKYNLIKDTRTGTNNSGARTWKPGTVGRGMSGPEVKALQTNLIAGGFLAPKKNGKPSDDGNFGADTETAVKALQTKLGFVGDAVDGAYGKDTKKAVAAKPDIFKSSGNNTADSQEKAIAELEAKFPPGALTVTGTPPKSIPITTIVDGDTETPKRSYARMFAIWAYYINRGSWTVDEFLKNGWSEADLALLIKYKLIDASKDTRPKPVRSNNVASVNADGTSTVTKNDGSSFVIPNANTWTTQQTDTALKRFIYLLDFVERPINEHVDLSVYFLHKLKLLEGNLNDQQVAEMEELARDLLYNKPNDDTVKNALARYERLKASGAIQKGATTAAAPSATTAATTASSEEARRAEHQKFSDEQKAREAQKAAMNLILSRVVSRYQVPPGKTMIGKEDGVFYYGDSNNRDAGSTDTSTGRAISMAMYKQGTNFVDQPLKDAIAMWPQIKIVQYVKPAGLGFWKGMQAAPTGSASIKGWEADGNGLPSINFGNSASSASTRSMTAQPTDNEIDMNPLSLTYGKRKNPQGLKDTDLEFQDRMRANALRSPPPVTLDEPKDGRIPIGTNPDGTLKYNTQESVGFQQDELNRIVSLVHHR